MGIRPSDMCGGAEGLAKQGFPCHPPPGERSEQADGPSFPSRQKTGFFDGQSPGRFGARGFSI